MMKATINGIQVEGTPQEIAEYQKRMEQKLPSDAADHEKFWKNMQIKTWDVNWPPGYGPGTVKYGKYAEQYPTTIALLGDTR